MAGTGTGAYSPTGKLKKPWKPFKPALRPPPGFYDPGIDAQAEAGSRGLKYLEQDTRLAGTRADNDYLIASGDVTRQKTEGLQDLSRDYWRNKQGFDWNRSDISTGTTRGLADLMTQRTRGTEDFATQRGHMTEDYSRSKGRMGEDYSTSRGRMTADYGTGKGRLGEDYTRSTQQLGRNFNVLGNQQTQTARAQGVAGGGALAQAMRKRAANQAWEQQAIDSSHNRAGEDLERGYGRGTADLDVGFRRGSEDLETGFGRATGALDLANSRFLDDNRLSRDRTVEDRMRADSRLNVQENWAGSDAATGADRVVSAADRSQGALSLALTRGGEDRTRGLERGRDENLFFQQDAGAQRFYSAKGTGWTPPTKPENEVGRGKNAYRVIERDGQKYRWFQDGRVEPMPQKKKGKGKR